MSAAGNFLSPKGYSRQILALSGINITVKKICRYALVIFYRPGTIETSQETILENL
jgi:hypothetical protein